jgi:hypothetical protein
MAMCFLLTVPELSKCCRKSEHRTLHSINARTAAYTLALPSLTRSWIKLVDCSLQPDGTYKLVAHPGIECSSTFPIGTFFACVWAVVVPARLFCILRQSAVDRQWSEEEIKSHAWMLLKYKPNRWWFVSYMLQLNELLSALVLSLI